ncbi:MAG: hypothetical protein IT459_21905 [Planctomycetes bacterium]|nr:hypothetical protein [Planctomycetota bacterium]
MRAPRMGRPSGLRCDRSLDIRSPAEVARVKPALGKGQVQAHDADAPHVVGRNLFAAVSNSMVA